MSSHASLEVRLYNASDALTLRGPMLAVYAASHQEHAGNAWYGGNQFWDRLTTLYAPSPSFSMVGAWAMGTMVGFAFGSLVGHPQPIWNMVETAGLNIKSRSPSDPIYFFREIAVDPAQQGSGCGRSLHDALLVPRSEGLAHLLVRTTNTSARAIYLHWGWRTVGQLQPFKESPLMDAMVHPLPLTTRRLGAPEEPDIP